MQSTNQRMEGLVINALLMQLYQPELLSAGPAARARSGWGSPLVEIQTAR